MSLPRQSSAVVPGTVEFAAEDLLTGEVAGFFRRCYDLGVIDPAAMRNPAGRDLLPFFEKYACDVLTAQLKARSTSVASPKNRSRLNNKLVKDLLKKITSKNGVWERVIRSSATIADFGGRRTTYGEYGPSDFMRPLKVPLEAALARCAARISTGENTTRLGRNIDRLRKECGWSFDKLAKKTGLDKKLILGHVNEGKGAYPKTIKVYADAFARDLNRTVEVAELEG
jgi:hypothetical protein